MAYTRQIINVGTVADDGSGDYLRDALVKVNTNFENLWDQGAVDSNIDLTGNTISTIISNLDLKLDPNGTGKIVVTANIEPDTTGAYDIGSSSKKINKIHSLKLTTDSTIFDGQASDPSGAVTGQVYYNTSTNNLKIYDNVGWKNLATTAVSGSFIELTNLSVTQNSASGNGTLSYNNSNGVFTYTPPDLSSYLTSVAFSSVTSKPTTLAGYGITDGLSLSALSVGAEASASGDGGVAYDNSTGVFTYTPPDLSGYTTANSTTTFTNKSGNISQWTNDLGYITTSAGWNVADDTSTVKQIRINDDLKIAGGAGITTAITGDTLTITGSVTASSTTTFTNKSGNISQWTNDSNYLTSVPAQSFASLTGKPTTLAGYGITDGYANTDVDSHLNQSNPTSGYVLSWNGSDYAWVAQSGGGLSDVVSDTTPQLGGDLDVNGNDIVTTSNGDIDLDPNGTGKVVFKGNATKGSGQFVLNCENNSHGVTIKGPPHSAAANYTLTLPNTDGSADQVLKTDGSGNLDWVAQSSGAPGGSTTQIQFNNSGSFAGDSDLTWTAGTNTLTAKNIVTESISPPSTLSGTYTISSPTTITLDPVTEVILDAPMKLKAYTAASLPTASAGSVASVSDQGYKPAYYDGSDWRYFSDNSTV